MKRVMAVMIVTVAMGCESPTAPTDCLDPSLEATHARLEGVRQGDPAYAEAARWATICPDWNLLSD